MRILYFAWIREAIGKSQEDITKPEGINTVQDLVMWLKKKDVGYRKAFSDNSVVRVAVNQEYVSLECLIANGDEIAFFPPVTGG